MVSIRAGLDVGRCVERIKSLLFAKGVKLFATIDHADEARAAGLEMPPTVVLVFGNPKAGTPLMLAAPTLALDLPMKILVAEHADGITWISYTAPSCLAKRHSLPADMTVALESIEPLVEAAAQPEPVSSSVR